MGDNATDPQAKPGDAQRVAVEVQAADTDTVAKAMEHVSTIVGTIAELAKSNQASTETTSTAAATTTAEANDEADGDDEGDETTQKAGGAAAAGKFPRQLFKQMLKSAGVTDAGALNSLLDGLSKQFNGMPMAAKPEKGAKTTKSANEQTAETSGTPLTVEMLQKASQLTPERVSALQSAFNTLKMVIEAITPGESPATHTPAGASLGGSAVRDLTSPNTTPTIKSAVSADVSDKQLVETLKSIADTLKGFAETQKALDGRVAAIEKTRPASNSVEGDGGTDSNTTKSKNIWAGVL